MSDTYNTVTGEPKPKWIHCPGCSGQIGVPANYPAEVICCPKCAAVVRIDETERVLWRAAARAPYVFSPKVPAQWIACHGCQGEIGVPPDWLGPTIACPKCGSIVAMRETSRVLWRPPKPEGAPATNAASRANSDAHGPTEPLPRSNSRASTPRAGPLRKPYSLGRILTGAVLVGVGVFIMVLSLFALSTHRFSALPRSSPNGNGSEQREAPRKQTEALADILRHGGSALVLGSGDQLRIVRVDFRGTKIRDADLDCLRGLEDLYSLDLSSTPITDAGLERLERLAATDLIKLKKICIRGTRISRRPAMPPNIEAVDPSTLERWYLDAHYEHGVWGMDHKGRWVMPNHGAITDVMPQREDEKAKTQVDSLPATNPSSQRTTPVTRRGFLTLYEHAVRRMEEGDEAAAEAQLALLVRLEPPDGECYKCRAMAHLQLGNLPMALSDANKAIGLIPSDPRAWRTRALIQEQQRDLEGAANDMQRAVDLAVGQSEGDEFLSIATEDANRLKTLARSSAR